jgi:anti-sigma factor RsiW
MTWTCEQTELRLGEYLDGLLNEAEQRAFDAHVNTCERCAPLVAGVSHLLANLHGMEELEAPPRLVYSILDKTLGPRDSAKGWRAVLGWVRAIASPRFAYGAVSVAVTLMVLLTASGFSWRRPKIADLSPVNLYRNADRQAHLVYARGSKFISDLRVVYEIQSRLHQENEIPTTPEGALPESSPNKQPGRTDGTRPASPRQQNRANGIGRGAEVLAAELPFLAPRRMQ